MADARFLAEVVKFYVAGGFARLLLRAPEDQLGRVIHMAAFTGPGHPRAFAVRIIAKEIPGLAWRGLLKRLSIDQLGYTTIDLMLDMGFDVNVLSRMVGKHVAVEVKDQEQTLQGG